MTLQLSDLAVFEITKTLYSQFKEQQQSKRLDEDHLPQFKRQFIKPLYPRKQIVQDNGETYFKKYSCQEICCILTPGRYLCCKSTQPDSVYKQFGLGVCMYSKFLKHLICFLIFVSLLACISVALYYFIAIQNQYPVTNTYQDTFFSGTIGIMSASYIKCSYSLIQSGQASFDLKCSNGQIKLLGPIFTNASKSDITNCREEKENYNNKLYIPEDFTQAQSCSTSNQECNITINSNKQTHFNSSDFVYQFMSFNYQCQNSSYPIGTITLTDEIILYIVVGIDILILVMFIVFMISEKFSENKEIQHFKQKNLAVNDFTIKVNGFNSQKVEQQLDQFIKGYYDTEMLKYNETSQIISKNPQDLFSNIVQIKIPESRQIIEKTQNRRKKYKQLFQLIEECFFDEDVDVRKYTDHQDFIKKCYYTADNENYQEYKHSLASKIKDFMDSKKELKEQRLQIKNNEQIYVYILLSNLKYKRKIFERSKKRCFKNQISVYNRKYSVSEPPVADMIIEENFYKFTCLRVLLVWIITLIICFGSYLLVGIAQFKQNQLAANNNFQQDCTMKFTTDQLVDYNITLKDTQAYVHCYCDYHLLQNIADLNFDVNQYCSTWLNNYILYLSIPILISLGIVIYNALISKIFKKMTVFEAHNQLTEELYSYIIKRSFILILNMGLILIVLNLDLQGNKYLKDFGFLFMGTYSDFTSDWYLNIGVVITLTFCFNIFLPILQLMLLTFLKCLKRLWDRKCFCRKTSKKTKKQYIQLYTDDVYPIEERYANIIAILVIMLAFSSVMPLVYIIGLLSFIFMSLSDKVLLFRVYQKPINYTANLQSKIFKTMYLILMVHCVTSALMLSSSQLIQAAGNITIQFPSGLTNSKFSQIISSAQLIPYVIVFIILAVWAIFYFTIVQFCSFCMEKCKNRIQLFHRHKQNADFLGCLNNYQLSRLKAFTEKQLHEIEAITKDKQMKDDNLRISESLNRKQYLIQKIAMKTANQIDNIYSSPTKERVHREEHTLIGKSGYGQIFDDTIHYRDKKIKILDKQFKVLLRNKQTQNIPQSNHQDNKQQNSAIELFPKKEAD